MTRTRLLGSGSADAAILPTRRAIPDTAFTIPLGYFAGGILVDQVFEPFMAAQPSEGLLAAVFGTGKGAGAAVLFFIIAVGGVLTCILFKKDKYIWRLESEAHGSFGKRLPMDRDMA